MGPVTHLQKRAHDFCGHVGSFAKMHNSTKCLGISSQSHFVLRMVHFSRRVGASWRNSRAMSRHRVAWLLVVGNDNNVLLSQSKVPPWQSITGTKVCGIDIGPHFYPRVFRKVQMLLQRRNSCFSLSMASHSLVIVPADAWWGPGGGVEATRDR